ncbi:MULTISPECIES: DUF4870 domain-containing protein [Pseudomonas]|jgi:hypothetical protein|uniref:Orotate phosphoribosyltransferase n=2 Tax=Pseudomonas abyssi TaxID=170540 RepID=A0ACD6B366_9PSED|nr:MULTISPECIES: DUF4870 domain-containing protein [Pseudomonadaceae]MAC98350.1 DUF4870 domain-containing protein [Pseudomonadales bacterium]MAG64818.1 DUF4870 domain-containing protein [Pseudomonadales bacterium]PBK04072.1 orotate phosphoribosyltransferase [Pseudomonas abyssi]RGP53032.1 orotate phosphoribosyltransferase [Halopseudomonas gallaeciensis]|tara:strand:+ start:108271 stop:108663 length:393 start_codon:yes stop_codon:yes gene_type:complete
MTDPVDPAVEAPEPPPGKPSSEARQWALIAHVSALLGCVLPFGNLIGPLIVWQLKKDMDPFVDDQGKEALNFQITVTLMLVVCVLLMLVLIGILLAWVVGIAALVLVIIAAIKSNEGTAYRYPFCWRLIK